MLSQVQFNYEGTRFPAITCRSRCLHLAQAQQDSHFISIYVGDIIVARHGSSCIEPLRTRLSQHFEITYDGEADLCLGLGIGINIDGSVKLHQFKYIDDML